MVEMTRSHGSNSPPSSSLYRLLCKRQLTFYTMSTAELQRCLLPLDGDCCAFKCKIRYARAESWPRDLLVSKERMRRLGSRTVVVALGSASGILVAARPGRHRFDALEVD